MNPIAFRYYAKKEMSEAIKAASDAYAADVKKCLDYAKSLGAYSMAVMTYDKTQFPIALTYEHRLSKNGGVPTWLCAERRLDDKWAYDPKRSTKKGREISERLAELEHKTYSQRLRELVGLGEYFLFGLYEGRPARCIPAVLTNKKEDALYIRLPICPSSEGEPSPWQWPGCEEIEHWEFVKGTEQ